MKLPEDLRKVKEAIQGRKPDEVREDAREVADEDDEEDEAETEEDKAEAESLSIEPSAEDAIVEAATEERDDRDYEEAPVEMGEVLGKMVTPKAERHDRETSRDIKLTKSNFEDRMYLMRIKAMIEICKEDGDELAEEFYRRMHGHYTNLIASDAGFTAKNIVSRRSIESRDVRLKKAKGGWFH